MFSMIANLHIHTEYSMLESAARIENLLDTAVQYDYQALAITDTDNTYGVIKFFQHAKKQNIKPIIGTLIKKNDQYIILLARNNAGYYEINHLISCKNLSVRKEFGLIAFIDQHIENCFILSPYTDILKQLSHNLLPFIFFELPLTLPYWEQQNIIRHSEEMNIDFIPTRPVCFLSPEDYNVYRLLVSIKNNTDIYQSEEECSEKKNNHLIPLQDFEKQLANHPGSIERIEKIVQQCNVEFEFDKIELPEIRFSRRRDSYRKLVHLCMRGLNKKMRKLEQPYIERLRKEITIIRKLHLESYFLIVYKIVCFAREQKISHTGRGSAANSLVCYLLNITFVDPIEYDLYFERFLHLKRKGLPDVDLDFPWNKRDRVIQFIYDTFKPEHTALISTHITFHMRSAVRETAKAFGMDDEQISKITKKIPFFSEIETRSEIIGELPEFRSVNFKDSLWEKILHYAVKILKFPRHISIHPGGMVVSRRHLSYFTSIEKAPKGFYVTQLDMYDIEKLGLLKIDILGQRSLAVIDKALEWLYPWELPDMRDIFKDKSTVSLIEKGRTIGCFYIESPAMRQLLKKLRVKTFRELTAASSIIRPGVAESGMMRKYIRFHRNPSSITYIHNDIKELLKETYGIMIYQEDVIKVAERIAGLKPEKGDILRKAMSDKIDSHKAIKELKEEFMSGCIKNEYSSSVADQLWDQVESFGGCAFCKAHSASYAQISFVVAYLKHYFPAQFMASVLSNRGGFYAPLVYIEEARRLKLKVLSPDVNRADYDFKSYKDAIMIGLSFVRSLPYDTINRILKERERKKFSDMYDFILRCNITETEFMLLTKCGAMDWTGYNRKQLFFLAGHINRIKRNLNGSLLLQNTSMINIPGMTDLSFRQKILFEFETLGFSFTANLLALIRPRVKIVKSHEMKNHVNQYVTMMGVKIFSRRIPSKKKKGFMKFISFMDQYGTFETFLPLKNYDRLAPASLASLILLVYGRVRDNFGAYTLNIEDIKPLEL